MSVLLRPVYRPRMSSLALGLVGWYPFVDYANGILVDHSGNNNHGTPTNSPPPGGGPTRVVASASRFIAASHQSISMPTLNAMVPNTGPFTMAAWMVTNVTTVQIPFARNASGAESFQINYNRNSDSKISFLRDNGVAIQVESSTLITNIQNIWTHVAGVYDGTNIYIYINGKSENSTATSGTPRNSGAEWGIGADVVNSGNPSYFNGSLADVRVYTRGLSPGEMLALWAEAYQPQIDIESIALAMTGSSSGTGTFPGQFTVSGPTVYDLFFPVNSVSHDWGGGVCKRTV